MMEIKVVLLTGLTNKGMQTLRLPPEKGLKLAVINERVSLWRDSVGLIAIDECVAEWT